MKVCVLNRKKVFLVLFVVLMAVMLFGMTGCGKKEKKGSDGAQEVKEFIWVPQSVDLGNVNTNDGVVVGNYLYSTKFEWDEATMQSKVSIQSISILDGSVGKEFPLALEQPEDGQGNRNMASFTFDSEGRLYTAEMLYRWDEATGQSSEQYFLCKYDADGNKLSEYDFTKDLGDNDYTYARGIELDRENRSYVLCGSQMICLFDAEGTYKGKIESGNDSYIQGLGMDKDGTMYAAVTEYGSGRNGTVLKEVDFAKKGFGASYENFPSGNSEGRLTAGLEKTFLVRDEMRLYEYDKNTQTAEEVLNWLDSDINGNFVNYVGALEDGRLLVVIRDWESGASEVDLLTKTKASEVKQKENIVIGSFYSNTSLQSAAVKFNKTNDKYHVSIKSYYDYNKVTSDNYMQVRDEAISRMNSDITSSNCPDILDLTQINTQQYAAKGLFEDLSAYLEKSSSLNRDDFLESVLESYTYKGTLLAIPRSFELMTVAGKTSEVGDKPGWTLEEMLAYANKYPDAMIFDYASKSDILEFLVSYNQGAFVDWESGKCSFDTDSFKNLLQFVNRFPDEYDWNSDDNRSTPTKIADGDVLLYREYIYQFDNIQQVDGMFGEPVTFIGYPNDEGTGGCYLQADGLLAITSKSKCKEGAWAFLESYLSAEQSRYNDFGFPTKKQALQTMMEDATKVEYILDENGEPLLDEDGEPLTYGGGGSMAYEDGWTYEFHITTQEEADRVMELIEIARPVTDSDPQIVNIIKEEAEGFFQGQKSVDDVASVIQSRVQLYVNENR